MLLAGLIFAAIAALVHVYIFVLESLRWTQPSTRRVFGVRSEADAVTMKQLAFNQGFYNLFLAVAVVVGIVVFATGEQAVGLTIVFVGAAMMFAASLVLVLSDRRALRAALVQGLMPLLAIALLVWGILV